MSASQSDQEPSDQEIARHCKLRSACFNDLERAKRILAEDPMSIHCRCVTGETPFHYVVIEDRIDLAAFLLEAGAAIDTADNFGSTPLMSAVRVGYVEMTRWLIDRGASVEPKTVNGDTALSCAVECNNRPAFHLLMKQKMKHPIDHYFDYITADMLLNDPDLPMRDELIKLGLTRREWC